MTRKVRRSSGGVHDLGLHVVRCPEYRRPVLGGRVAERLDELIRQKAAERGWEIIALEVMPDHVHLFVLIVETRFSDVRPDTVYRRLFLKGTGPHALRHARASLLIAAGESVKVVSARLGTPTLR